MWFIPQPKALKLTVWLQCKQLRSRSKFLTFFKYPTASSLSIPHPFQSIGPLLSFWSGQAASPTVEFIVRMQKRREAMMAGRIVIIGAEQQVQNKNNILGMKQTSSVSKVSEEMKKKQKLNLSKNTLQQRESSKPFERLKSHDEGESESNLKQIKPKSSMSRRPMSSQKYTETVTSIATSSSAKSEEEVKEIITTIFNHSKKLQNFLAEKGLDQGRALETLLGNELFTLSLVTMVSNKNPEEINKYVERSCIHKLDRIVAMEKQKSICEGLESKIEELIDKRIKALSHYQ